MRKFIRKKMGLFLSLIMVVCAINPMVAHAEESEQMIQSNTIISIGNEEVEMDELSNANQLSHSASDVISLEEAGNASGIMSLTDEEQNLTRDADPGNTNPNNAVVFDDDYYVTSGTISTVGGYRWYAFQTEAETKVTALMVMNQTMDADFYLYKLNEDTMQLEFVNGSAVDGAGEMEYYTDIIGDGVYFIGINGYSGTGTFTFAFYKCTYDALAEFNDTLASAIDVTYGQQYSGVIDNPMDHDFYTLTLSEPTIIKYNFSSSLNYSLKWFDTSIGDFSDAVYFTDGPAEYFKLSAGTHYFAVRTTDSDIFSSTVPYYLTFTKVGTYSGNSNLYIRGINEETGIILESTAAPGNNMITNYVNGHPIDISYSLNQNYSNSAGGQNYNISINANAGAYISMYEGEKPEIAYYYGSTRPAMSVSNRNVLKLTYRCNSNFYRINCFCTGAYAMNNYSQTYNYVTVIIDPETGKLIDIVEFNYYYDFAPVGSNYITCPSIYPMTLFY